MLPHKTKRGQAALERLKVFDGIPPPYDKVIKVNQQCGIALCGLNGIVCDVNKFPLHALFELKLITNHV